MTERKEIIEMLKVLKEQALKSHNDTAIIDVKKDSFIYVMNVAINSLEIDERYELEYEQIEPCEDAISRQAVQDYIAKYLSQFLYDDVRQAIEVIDEYIGELPSVNPQVICPSHGIDCEDCPAYEPKTDVLDKIRDEIDEKISHYEHFSSSNTANGLMIAKKIVNKYKAESEEVQNADK